MAKYKIWDRTYPITTGVKFYADANEFGKANETGEMAVKNPNSKWIIDGDDDNVTGCFMEFNQTKRFYRNQIKDVIAQHPNYTGVAITDEMSDVEVLAAIEYFEEHPITTPSAEDRIAAQMEYSNILNS